MQTFEISVILSSTKYTIEAKNFKGVRQLLALTEKRHVYVQSVDTGRGLEMDFRAKRGGNVVDSNESLDPWARNKPLDKRTAGYQVSNFNVVF